MSADDTLTFPAWDGTTFEMARPFAGASQTGQMEPAAPQPEPEPPSWPRFHRMPVIPPRHPYAIWEALGGIGIQRCGGCKTVYTDESVRDEDSILDATCRSAGRAGWSDDHGHGDWLCPACRGASEALPAPLLHVADAAEEWLVAHLAFLAEIDAGQEMAGMLGRAGVPAEFREIEDARLRGEQDEWGRLPDEVRREWLGAAARDAETPDQVTPQEGDGEREAVA